MATFSFVWIIYTYESYLFDILTFIIYALRAFVGANLSARICRRTFDLRANDGIPINIFVYTPACHDDDNNNNNDNEDLI